MARAPTTRITQAAVRGQPSLNRRLRRWLGQLLPEIKKQIEHSAEHCGAERYRKHFDSFAHACILIFHGLSSGFSLRQSYAAFPACRGLAVASGLLASQDPEDERLGVSLSQLADSNTTRPAAFLGGVIPFLIARVRQSGLIVQSGLPPELHILDSTFLRVSLLLAPWLPSNNRADIPGMRAHVQYAPALDLPEQILVTDSRISDKKGFDRLILDNPEQLERFRGHTLLIDLGYYAHQRFCQLMQADVHFLSRLHPTARFQVLENLPIQQSLPAFESGRIRTVSDQRVTLGSVKNGSYLEGLRLVTAWVQPLPRAARLSGAKTVLYQVITDRFDLSSQEVIQAYLWRWQIELFFRWLKSHIRMPRLLGYSRNAMELTVYLAIAVHLISVLAAQSLGILRRSPALLNQLRLAVISMTSQELCGPEPSAYQLRLPSLDPDPSGPT
jgi:hypothetical protein